MVYDLPQEKQEKHSLIGFSLILLEKLFLTPFLAVELWVLRQFLEVQKKTFLIEKNIKVFKSLKSNLEFIGSTRFELVNEDSINYLKKLEHDAFDYIFLDPPFSQQILPLILNLLYEGKLIHSDSQIYIESEFQITEEFLDNNCDYECKINKEKKSGSVYFCLISLGAI